MKKYLSIIKMVMLEKSEYLYNQLFKMIIYAVFIYVFLQLWGYMYNDTKLIAGYTLSQMTWYVAFTEMIWGAIRPRAIRNELSDEIRSGKIAYVLNKPFSYIGYLISKYLGEAIVGLLTYIIIGTAISFIIIGPLTTFNISVLPFVLITTIIATFITGLIYILIALSAFWIEENSPLFWIYEKLILCIGVLFPIEIFPQAVQPFIKFSPVYVTTYAPAKIAVDFSLKTFINITVFQLGYLTIVGLLCFLVYRKGVKKLNVNGG